MLATAMKQVPLSLMAALGGPSVSAVLPTAQILANRLHTSTVSGKSCAMPAAPAAYRHLAPAALHTSMRHQSSIPFASFKTLDPNKHTYTSELVESIEPGHLDPSKMYQKAGFHSVQAARRLFDWSTGYGETSMTEAKWIQRFLFLETVAGVPGMVAGMLRHLKSLRTMKRDNGWISTLLDEAENERMHLLTFLEVRKPGFLFRSMVILAQGVFFNAYFVAYLLSPKYCHSFVGYLEEEAVKTYTHALKDIDSGCLEHWQKAPAPEIATTYWKLAPGASMRDLILAVRADEAGHSHVNHTLSIINKDDTNPFRANSKQEV